MLRFVILLHETPAGYSRGTHYDLMLERGEALQTWAVEKLPAEGETVNAQRLPDHRASYLDYEGEVAGDRGRVSRVDGGEYEIVSETAEVLIVELRGSNLRGTLTLSLNSGDLSHWQARWND